MGENVKLKILERTFGLEMEYADVDKQNVILPKLFEWDKVETIHNTDGTIGTYSGRFGGEINTPPMFFNHEAKTNLRQLLESLIDNGANARRDLALQVHIYIGDLDVDEIKRIFCLCYHTSNILKEVCHEPPYSDEQRYRPSPTLDYYQRIMKAKDLQGVRQVLENSSNKGWMRHFVNVSSYFVRKTVEFRLFNSTLNIEEMLNCILFAYRFVDYALKHTEEDFKEIRTKEDFRRELKTPMRLPNLGPALLYFSSVDQQDKGLLLHKALGLSNPMVGVLAENTGENVSCVNPLLYSVEVRLMKSKKIAIYNNDEFHHLIYLTAKGELQIRYNRKAEFLEEYNDGTPASQVACLLILRRLKSFFADNEYARANLDAYKHEMHLTYPKAKSSAERICALIENSTYKLGTLNDALMDGGDVFFQFDSYVKFRTLVGVIKRNSDYSGSFVSKRTHYDGIPADMRNATSLSIVSTNPYLPMEKVAQMRDKCFYKTAKAETHKITHKKADERIASFPVPPDDLRIEDLSLLRVCQVAPSILRQVQERFIKKVQKVSGARFAYMVFYDKYLIGGFGFVPTKMAEYDIWLLSDFCTNNAIPRLSKLILLIIKSKRVKRSISRRMRRDTVSVYTKVYTHAPVSMKYRGCFNLADRESNHLLYATELGSAGSDEDVLRKYHSYLKKK